MSLHDESAVRTARRSFNAALRGRLGGPAPSSGGPVPDAVQGATAALSDALAAGDADRILAAEDRLDQTIRAASAPQPQARDWGQGARGTGTAPRALDQVNDRIRDAMFAKP